jgi:hypothetical protein
MRQLEERLGLRLLHRTTRSVSVTDAGLRLLEQLRPAIEQIAGAIENLNRERQRPLGRLRIYAGRTAAVAVVALVWGRFLSTYPEIHLELAVGEAPITRRFMASSLTSCPCTWDDRETRHQDRCRRPLRVTQCFGRASALMGAEEDLGQQLSVPTVNSRFTSEPPTSACQRPHIGAGHFLIPALVWKAGRVVSKPLAGC